MSTCADRLEALTYVWLGLGGVDEVPQQHRVRIECRRSHHLRCDSTVVLDLIRLDVGERRRQSLVLWYVGWRKMKEAQASEVGKIELGAGCGSEEKTYDVVVAGHERAPNERHVSSTFVCSLAVGLLPVHLHFMTPHWMSFKNAESHPSTGMKSLVYDSFPLDGVYSIY
jgi:hypothetical protein